MQRSKSFGEIIFFEFFLRWVETIMLVLIHLPRFKIWIKKIDIIIPVLIADMKLYLGGELMVYKELFNFLYWKRSKYAYPFCLCKSLNLYPTVLLSRKFGFVGKRSKYGNTLKSQKRKTYCLKILFFNLWNI